MATEYERHLKGTIKNRREFLKHAPEEFVETMQFMLYTAKAMAEESAEASSPNSAEKWAAAAKHLTIAADKMGGLWHFFVEQTE